MYAIIQTGGKQYKVEVGDQILVEKLESNVSDEVDFETLLVADDSGVKVGKPVLSGVSVRGKVLEHGKGKKVVILKYKQRKIPVRSAAIASRIPRSRFSRSGKAVW